MSDVIRIEGFVIVPPLAAWDEKHRDEIWSYLSPGSFGRTEAEAWRRHIQHPHGDAGEFASKVQFWHDRGYRVKSAVMEITP